MEDKGLTPISKKKLSDFAAEALKEYIDQQLKQGRTKLPPEIELAQTLSVSRTTIRRALSTLEDKGIIQRVHGKGTFINPGLSQVRLNFTSGRPLHQLIKSCGFEPSVQPLYLYKCDPSPLQQTVLALDGDEQIMTICKVYCADKIPVVLVVDDVPARLIEPEIDEAESALSTFELIRRHSGILCTRDKIEISSADSAAILTYSTGKSILNCDSALVLDTINYSENNTPVFLSKQFFNTNYIKFNMIRLLEVYE